MALLPLLLFFFSPSPSSGWELWWMGRRIWKRRWCLFIIIMRHPLSFPSNGVFSFFLNGLLPLFFFSLFSLFLFLFLFLLLFFSSKPPFLLFPLEFKFLTFSKEFGTRKTLLLWELVPPFPLYLWLEKSSFRSFPSFIKNSMFYSFLSSFSFVFPFPFPFSFFHTSSFCSLFLPIFA